MRASRLIAGMLGVALLAAGGASRAEELVRRTFGAEGWSQEGDAAPLELPLRLAEVSRGAISLDLRRSGDIPADAAETVFSLVDDDGTQVLRVQVSWTAQGRRAAARLVFRGPGTGGELLRYGVGLWGPVVELDRPVEDGQAVHLDLTWDDGTREYGVYADGELQTRSSGGNDPGRYFTPEMLRQVNRHLERENLPRLSDSLPLGSFLGGVVAVRLGSSGPPVPAGAETEPAHGARRPLLLGARIEGFAVYGGEIPTPGTLPPPEGPAIASVEHDAFRAAGFSGKLVAGDAPTVTLTGTPGATATFDVVHYPDMDGRVELDWRGWGVYLEEKVFFDKDEVDLHEVEGYLVYAAQEPFDLAAPGIEPVAELDVEEQRYTLDRLEVDAPCYAAVLARMRDGSLRPVIRPVVDRPMAEEEPGVYAGTYEVSYADRLPRAAVVGRLRRGGQAATLVADRAIEVDPSLTVAVAAAPGELRADESSTAEVTVTVTNANGDAVAGHEVRFLLATTSQYTGVVGGGAFAEQVGGTLRESAHGETDLFGRLTATYVAGFAAKTAVIVARDMVSNDTGAAHVKTYIQASAGLELEPVVTPLAAEGYAIEVTSSDDWLTADGRSRARITARVTRLGEPVEGHRVAFAVTGGGSVSTASGTTGRDGRARAVYTAGTKIGVALVTATDLDVDISGSVAIELRSDAPAKLVIRIDPERLPADGRSRADVLVTVTDINDNPNADVEVEYALAGGGGRLDDDRTTTDRRGETGTRYVAGGSPGPVRIEITVRSTTPTEEELRSARDLAVTVQDPDFF